MVVRATDTTTGADGRRGIVGIDGPGGERVRSAACTGPGERPGRTARVFSDFRSIGQELDARDPAVHVLGRRSQRDARGIRVGAACLRRGQRDRRRLVGHRDRNRGARSESKAPIERTGDHCVRARRSGGPVHGEGSCSDLRYLLAVDPELDHLDGPIGIGRGRVERHRASDRNLCAVDGTREDNRRWLIRRRRRSGRRRPGHPMHRVISVTDRLGPRQRRSAAIWFGRPRGRVAKLDVLDGHLGNETKIRPRGGDRRAGV